MKIYSWKFTHGKFTHGKFALVFWGCIFCIYCLFLFSSLVSTWWTRSQRSQVKGTWALARCKLFLYILLTSFYLAKTSSISVQVAVLSCHLQHWHDWLCLLLLSAVVKVIIAISPAHILSAFNHCSLRLPFFHHSPFHSIFVVVIFALLFFEPPLFWIK